MVVFPGEVTDDDINSSFEVTPRQIKNILKNPLNEIVVYDNTSNCTKVQIALKKISPWQSQIVRKYIFYTNAFNWAISNLDTEAEPNAICPICGRYELIRQYIGRNILPIICLNCDNYDVIFSDEVHDNYCSKKVDWKKEGF